MYCRGITAPCLDLKTWQRVKPAGKLYETARTTEKTRAAIIALSSAGNLTRTTNKPEQYKMETLINNFINGNLTKAQQQAKHFKLADIRETLIDNYGYSFKKATLTAEYLKNRSGFQVACDAE